MANVLNEEAAWMDILSAQSYLDCISKETDERIEIYLARFLMLSKALKRRVLRLAIEKLRPDLRDIGFNAINRGLNFVDKASSGEQIDLIARLNLAVVHDLLIIKTWTARLPDFELPLVMEQSFVGSLEIDKRINLRNRWSLEATLPTEMPADLLKAVKHISINEAWLDFDKVAMPLTVRGPRAGERFQPLGMAGHSQSLQDLFVNQKVPGHLRPFWPLIVSEENIAWVVGLRPSEVFKITNNTQRILKIQLIKES
jgi:tRNA(Ile)-lysidine synthase